jgi:hypothetical protein
VVWERANSAMDTKKRVQFKKNEQTEMWDHDTVEPKDKIKRCDLTAPGVRLTNQRKITETNQTEEKKHIKKADGVKLR